jgi:HlyD family secretion protein
MKRAIIVLLIIAAIGAGAGAYYMTRGGNEVQVNTLPVTRGDIIDTVGATGAMQAVITVTVGSQVSGNIASLGADFNSIVHKGQVIARLDPSLFEAQLQQAKANLNQARANLNKAQSDLEHAKVMLLDAQQKYTRAKELSVKQLETQSDLDAAKIAVDSAQASLESQQATVAQSEAAITQSEASVNQNQVNLDHTVIEAPIDGIITQRSVDVGQTVQASMSAPTLFIIAADLTKMQINANIDEADVGRIRPGQTTTFRVDAYPGEQFEGTVAQIRLNPVVIQNVTTYGTIIDVPNPELKLKPGMTANLKVQIAKRTNAVRVPNTATRFRPTLDMFTALNQQVPPEAQPGGGRGRGGRGQGGTGGGGSLATGVAAGPGTGPGTGPGAPTAFAQRSGSPTPGGPVGAAADNPLKPSARGDGGGRFGRGGQGDQGAGDPGRGGRGGGGDNPERRAQMLERFKTMAPDQQKQFIERMKSRGQDVTAFEKTTVTKKAPPVQPKYGVVQSGETIDALFGPIATVESSGRAWLYLSDKKELKPVNLRLGITDGTNTELVSGELQPGQELVTGMILGSARTSAAAGAGNPLLPQNQRGNQGGFGGGGGRGR